MAQFYAITSQTTFDKQQILTTTYDTTVVTNQIFDNSTEMSGVTDWPEVRAFTGWQEEVPVYRIGIIMVNESFLPFRMEMAGPAIGIKERVVCYNFI